MTVDGCFLPSVDADAEDSSVTVTGGVIVTVCGSVRDCALDWELSCSVDEGCDPVSEIQSWSQKGFLT